MSDGEVALGRERGGREGTFDTLATGITVLDATEAIQILTFSEDICFFSLVT